MDKEEDVLLKNPFGFELAGALVNDSVTREAVTKDQMRKFWKFIHRIEYLCKMEPQMKEVLRMRRARPVVTRYDILEGWLCYYERGLSDLPLVQKRCLSNDSILLRA